MTQAQASEGYRPGYPIYLDLCGHKVVVVGAGRVALRKVQKLLEYGAQVTVVAPRASDEIVALAQTGRLTWVRRAYRSGDLDGATICFSVCGQPDVDRQVCADAHAKGCLVNVVDVPSLCDFTVPAVVALRLDAFVSSLDGQRFLRASAQGSAADSAPAFGDRRAYQMDPAKDAARWLAE